MNRADFAGLGVVEVPARAFDDVLELLRDLLDAGELEGDRCPLCNKSVDGEVWRHRGDCPVGRARTALDAIQRESRPCKALVGRHVRLRHRARTEDTMFAAGEVLRVERAERGRSRRWRLHLVTRDGRQLEAPRSAVTLVPALHVARRVDVLKDIADAALEVATAAEPRRSGGYYVTAEVMGELRGTVHHWLKVEADEEIEGS